MLNGSVFYILLAFFVAYFGLTYDSRLEVVPKKTLSSDLKSFSIPNNSIHAELVRFIARILTPRWFIALLRKISQ